MLQKIIQYNYNNNSTIDLNVKWISAMTKSMNVYKCMFILLLLDNWVCMTVCVCVWRYMFLFILL